MLSFSQKSTVTAVNFMTEGNASWLSTRESPRAAEPRQEVISFAQVITLWEYLSRQAEKTARGDSCLFERREEKLLSKQECIPLGAREKNVKWSYLHGSEEDGSV